MSSQQYIKSITEMVPDEFPTLTPLPETSSSANGGFMNMSLQTWIIIILILALIGINIFAYLAIGTEAIVKVFERIFAPILKLVGYNVLETTKTTIETTAEGSKAGIDIVADVTTSAIDNVQETTEINGNKASSSLPVQSKIHESGSDQEKWQKDSLALAINDSKNRMNENVMPDDSRSSIQTTGKSGWCYIGEDQGIRTCSEIGVNDVCMSGDIFPTQAVCMNPKLRA
jgi:hypothetical protein